MLFLLSKASKDMHQSIVPILFSLLESHASSAKFTHPDQNRGEMCGMMGNLAADRRRRKGPTVMTGGSPLPRLPPARRGGAHETGRTHPIPQHAQGGDGRPRVRRGTERPPSGSPHARQGSSWTTRGEPPGSPPAVK